MKQVVEIAKALSNNIQKVIVGKEETVENVIVSLLSRGHLLIEDVPGVGKTMLARALARSLDCRFQRIQFTPDMLPSDIIGVSIYNPQIQKFEYRAGPIISEIVLADEINRASPKTQSSLLEAMEENQVSVDGTTYRLPEIFMVIATQNILNSEGTFPLPVAQLDRFLLRINLGYPSAEAEEEMLTRQQLTHPIEQLQSVVSGEELIKAQKKVKEVYVSEEIKRYIVKIVEKTRTYEGFLCGASPRGSLALFRTAQARAAMEGRDFATPYDVKRMVLPCLAHRVVARSGYKEEELLEEILRGVPVPK